MNIRRRSEKSKSRFNFKNDGVDINPMVIVVVAFITAVIISVPISLISKNKKDITSKPIEKLEILKNGEKSNIFLIDNGNNTYKIIKID